MAQFTPPPTYADPVIKDDKTGKFVFNPIWLKWFVDQAAFISSNGGTTGTISHESLADLEGGALNDHQHLKTSELDDLHAGLLRAIVAVTDGAGVSAGTLNNAPFAGNPTKWIPFNDNGTVRYIPTW